MATPDRFFDPMVTTSNPVAASPCGCSHSSLPPGGRDMFISATLPISPGGFVPIPLINDGPTPMPLPCTAQTTPMAPGGFPPDDIVRPQNCILSLSDCSFLVGDTTPTFASTLTGAGVGDTVALGLGGISTPYRPVAPASPTQPGTSRVEADISSAFPPGGMKTPPIQPCDGYRNYSGTLTLRSGKIVSKT